MQPADEWKIEQGWDAFELSLVDQTAENPSDVQSLLPEPSVEPAEADAGVKIIGEDPNILFAEEREGWHGYVLPNSCSSLLASLVRSPQIGQALIVCPTT
jgi:hypothetical protein